MPFTSKKFGLKLTHLRRSFDESTEALAAATGISTERLDEFERGTIEPTGDEVLIISDHFRHDFLWFIDDDAPNPDENMQTLFRVASDQLSTADKHAVNEFLFLCKSQALLERLLELKPKQGDFKFTAKGQYFIGHGLDCAREFREWHQLPSNAVIPNLFDWLREHGLRVFRRDLPDSPISGLFIDHPEAGRCILINSTEDKFRQRFSAAHEIGHALMDIDKAYNISNAHDQSSDDYREIRANAFAAAFLMPKQLLDRLGTANDWSSPDKLVSTAEKLWVSVPALLSALVQAKIIDKEARNKLRELKLKIPDKQEPELMGDLAPKELVRKQQLLKMGLHTQYVGQCFEAYRRDLISLGKLAEILLVDVGEVAQVANLFGTRVDYA